MAARSSTFDLPPWGLALCALLVLVINIVLIIPCVTAVPQNNASGQDYDSLMVAAPGREDEIVFLYVPAMHRMTVVVFPQWADDTVSISVFKQGNVNDDPVQIYGPVTYEEANRLQSIKYSYDIKEPHLLTVTTLRSDGGLSSRYRVSFGGLFAQEAALEVALV